MKGMVISLKLSEMATRMIYVIAICVVVILFVGALLAYLDIARFLPIALGAVFGAAISVLKVIMIDMTVKKVTGMDTVKVSNFVRGQHILRFVLTGVLFVVAAIVQFINIYSAAAGVLSFQAATMSTRKVLTHPNKGG